MRWYWRRSEDPQLANIIHDCKGLTRAVLDHFDDLLPTLENLGRRHVVFGVEDKDYITARIALIWSLEHGLGEEFTYEVKEAWLAIYDKLANAMTKAAIHYREEREEQSSAG